MPIKQPVTPAMSDALCWSAPPAGQWECLSLVQPSLHCSSDLLCVPTLAVGQYKFYTCNLIHSMHRLCRGDPIHRLQ